MKFLSYKGGHTQIYTQIHRFTQIWTQIYRVVRSRFPELEGSTPVTGQPGQNVVLSLTRSKAVLAAKCVELAFYTAQFDRLLSAWDLPPDLGAHQRTVLCACANARTHTNAPTGT